MRKRHSLPEGHPRDETPSYPTDASSLFAQFGVRQKVKGVFNEYTYAIDARPENNWLFPAFKGFEVLKTRIAAEGQTVRTFVTVGTGGGWDAIGGHHIFQPKRLIATDNHPKVLRVADRNIRENVTDEDVEILTLHGDLCAPLREKKILADVLYANLPLLPDDPAHVLEGMRSSTFADWERIKQAPTIYQRYRLAMKYVLLNDAASSLAPHGSVAINLGGRVPVELIQRMFDECGYTYEELYTMLKLQTQPDEVLPGFAAAEKEGGVEFDFYRLPHTRKAASTLRPSFPAKKWKDTLLPHRVSAERAVRLHARGVPIGHIVQMIGGQRKRTDTVIH